MNASQITLKALLSQRCNRLRQQAREARGNATLLQLLAKEAQAMACDISELLDLY